MSRRTMGGAALVVALLTTLVLGSAWAQGSGSQTLQLTPSRDSGVSGTATLTETGGQVQVQLNLQGLPQDGVEHLAHIHSGATCADDRAGQGGPVEFPLESVTAQGGAGSSTSTIDTTLSNLFDGTQRYVNVHAERTGEGVPPGIACADVVSTTGGGSLPSSGGIPTLPIGTAAVTLISLGIMSRYLARRRAV